MISIDRLKEMALEYIEENPEKHLEESTELLQQLDQLKAENEELKKDVIEALKLVEITSTHNTFQESRINKLSKTLTEIKDIAERVKGYDPLANQILQKISEVEE